jgi:hypothetical protein
MMQKSIGLVDHRQKLLTERLLDCCPGLGIGDLTINAPPVK